MTDTTGRALLTGRVATRVGAVGVYATGTSLDLVKRSRELAGRVTVAGPSGRDVICTLAADGDLRDVDYDPAEYLKRNGVPDQLALFDIGCEAWQRDQGLAVVRSRGVYVKREDWQSLADAFTTPVGADVVRVVSIDGWWLSAGLRELLARVRGCGDALAFVLAAAFDPLNEPGAVDGLRALVDVARDRGRRVELLRSDVTAIGFAAVGGSLGTIGVSTSTRHHGLPMKRTARDAYKDRQRTPYVFVAALLSWHRGTDLGALSKVGGAGICCCSCPVCDGRSLLRFDRTWPREVPDDVRREARAHDLHCCISLAQRVLAESNPADTWARECAAAVATSTRIQHDDKVLLRIPKSISGWI